MSVVAGRDALSGVMCEQCKAIDKRIEHYREMPTHVIDQPMLDGISLLIVKLESDKKALHPEQT